MAWKNKKELGENGLELIYAWDEDKPASRHLAYQLDKQVKQIKYFPVPSDKFCVKEVTLEGFTNLPEEFAPTGYIKSGATRYYLNKKLSEYKIATLSISRGSKSTFRKLPKVRRHRVNLSYSDFRSLRDGMTQIATEAKDQRSEFADNFFNRVFPSKYRASQTATIRHHAVRLVRSLDVSVIPELKPNEVDKIVDFVADVLAKRYSAQQSKLKLLKAAKIKVDEVTLLEVIRNFERNLTDDVAEAVWGQFLEKNLFMVDSKYIGVLPQLNLVLGSQRKVDFGLFDSQGYLDLFEIKKCSTRLLSSSTDRGNYYWHSDTVKAIAQAEKYLHHAERKATQLMEDLKREREVSVEIVKPKAVIIIGQAAQLNDAKKKTDFRILRSSLKNVELVTYDELLERLKNQKAKIYGTPVVEAVKSLEAA